MLLFFLGIGIFFFLAALLFGFLEYPSGGWPVKLQVAGMVGIAAAVGAMLLSMRDWKQHRRVASGIRTKLQANQKMTEEEFQSFFLASDQQRAVAVRKVLGEYFRISPEYIGPEESFDEIKQLSPGIFFFIAERMTNEGEPGDYVFPSIPTPFEGPVTFKMLMHFVRDDS